MENSSSAVSTFFEDARAQSAVPNASAPSAFMEQLLRRRDLIAPRSIAVARAAAPLSVISLLLLRSISARAVPDAAKARETHPSSVIRLLLRSSFRTQPGLSRIARANASQPASEIPQADRSNTSNNGSLDCGEVRKAAAKAAAPASPTAALLPKYSDLNDRLCGDSLLALLAEFNNPLPIDLHAAGPRPQQSNRNVLGQTPPSTRASRDLTRFLCCDRSGVSKSFSDMSSDSM
mmetsp:Transcript_24098/g.69274  ORF Transcript_24098/g.69274 Transcript_24098/m.69274 type:complete len:234 (-) Transcript_24098:488-1189(-)